MFELVAATGEQAPGAPLGARFKEFRANTGRPVLNDDGALAFQAFLVPGSGGVTAGNDVGIWSKDDGGSLVLLARSGQQAGSDLPAGATFRDFSIPPINNNGEVAFQARLNPDMGGVAVGSDEGIWIADAERGLELVAREGDPAIGVAPSTLYAGGFSVGCFDDFRGLCATEVRRKPPGSTTRKG